MAALTPDAAGVWQAQIPPGDARPYRLCANYDQVSVCNWVVRGRRSERLLSLVPAESHHSRSVLGAKPGRLVPARGREAPLALYAAWAWIFPSSRRTATTAASPSSSSRTRGRRCQASADRSRQRPHHHQHRGGRRCASRAAALPAEGALSHAFGAFPPRDRALLLGPAHRLRPAARGLPHALRR